MKARVVSPVQIRRRGLQALAKALGPVGMVRFLQQFDSGSGDYTKERPQWLGGLTLREMMKEIRKQRLKTSD